MAKKVKKEKRESRSSMASAKSSSSKKSSKRSSNRSSSSSSKKSSSSSKTPGASRRYHAMAKETLKRDPIITGNTSLTFGGSLLLPAMSLRDAMKGISMMRPLHEGISVLKLNSNGNKLQKRTLTLSSDQMTLFVTHGKVSADTKAAKLKTPIYTPSKGFGKQDSGNYLRYIDVADLESFNVGVISNQTLEDSNLNKEKWIPFVVTIFHHEHFGKRYLNLIIEDPAHRMGLVAALQLMKRSYEEAQQWVSRSVLLMRYIWYDIDKDNNQLISKDEFALICERINFHINEPHKIFKSYIEQQQESNKTTTTTMIENNKTELTYGECMDLIERLKSSTRQVVDLIWAKTFGRENDITVLSAKTVLGFLHNVQGERDNDLSDAKDLIAILNHIELSPSHLDHDGSSTTTSTTNKLDKNRFAEYLYSPLNDAFNPDHQKFPPPQKLTKPLSHYWINTSHNTYLTGDQLRSKSSVEAYGNALRRGCKCLELDCWDGKKNKSSNKTTTTGEGGGEVLLQVDVFHGPHTSTSKISFLSIIVLINNYLINNPDSYPIILSIENHCSVPYQDRMAEILKTTLGNKLYIPTAKARKDDMPSPEQLKGRVLINAKKPPDADDKKEEVKIMASTRYTSSSRPEDEADLYGKMFDKFEGVNNNTNESLSGLVPGEGGPAEESAAATTSSVVLPKYADSMLELIYFHGAKFENFEESCLMIPSHMHSISESKIRSVADKYADSPKLWRQYNMDHMTRTYPAGVRVDSSNYNPMLAWSLGCQMVALNFQTSDTHLILNDGRFRANGGCGYVPKPASVMEENGGGGGAGPEGLAIKIRVLGASCLPKPNGEKGGDKKVNPFVQVELHDVRVRRGREEYYSISHHTKAIRDNGFCPIWRDDGHQFNVHHSDVAMFVFKVINDNDVGVGGDDRIACAAIPTKSLRQGFRSVQLYNYRNNSQLGPFQMATILVHIQQSRPKTTTTT